MSLYDWLAQNPELGPLYAAFAIIFVAWVYGSTRKLIVWYSSIVPAFGRGNILPPDDVTGEIVAFLLVIAVNLVLLGAYIYVIT